MLPQQNQPIGYPISPELLETLGALKGIPLPHKDFDPVSNWKLKYGIWVCRGYFNRGNEFLGALDLEREKNADLGTHLLKVKKTYVCSEGFTHIMKAEIECSSEIPSQPLEWAFSNKQIDPEGREMTEVGYNESGWRKNDIVAIKKGRKTYEYNTPGVVTGDWNVFEFIQRIPFTKDSKVGFNMIERLDLPKNEQTLRYRSPETWMIGDREWTLHRFSQIGQGILPFDFWLDDFHRLLIASTFSIAYILDEQADEKYMERKELLLGTYNRLKKRYQKENV